MCSTNDFVFSEGLIMAKGGARFGAGRPPYKVKAEQVQRVDVRVWQRRKLLDREGTFSWSWNRGGEPTGSIGVAVNVGKAVELRYTFSSGGDVQPINERVFLAYSPCHFGGARTWFVCPRCDQRREVLYLRNGRFACRHCQRVAYSSQSEDVIARMWRKQGRIETRLGDDWKRPKGMRHRTYEHLLERLQSCEEMKDLACSVFLTQFLADFKR